MPRHMDQSTRNGIIAIILCTLALAGCGGKHPPTSYSSRSGEKASQRPYVVMGKRYEPLKSHVGFFQEGVASWYGKDFDGKPTSSGEIYDMHAMTAAHKTLPLGVYVKVTNRDNGNSVVVKVNDRGPFVKNRVIDLSYAAARKLGYDDIGTARVRIEALGYGGGGSSDKEKYREPASYDSGNYSVQVGAFKDPQNARRLSEELKKRYGFSDVKSAMVNGELFYRVQAGKYSSLSKAEEAEKDFEMDGYPGSFSVSLD
jgi:rare lipoprotein A